MKQEDLEKFIAETPAWMKHLAAQFPPSFARPEPKEEPKLRIVKPIQGGV